MKVPPPRSFTYAIFRAVFDSRSSFFAPKPHGNACYVGEIFPQKGAGSDFSPGRPLGEWEDSNLCFFFNEWQLSVK